jgi:hypothetical protein
MQLAMVRPMPPKDEMLQQVSAALKAKIGTSNDANTRGD